MSTNSKITNAINVLKREQDGFGMVTTRVSEVAAPATISRLETVQDEKTGVWSQKEVIEKTEAKDERVIDQLEWEFKDDAESLRLMADLIDQKIMSFNGDIDFKKVENVRRHWPFFRDRRIDFYKGILNNPKDA